MIRLVGPLLLGLGACAVSGCAMAGASPRFLAERGPWKGRGSAPAMPESSGNLAEPERVAFRKPARDSATTSESDATFTGHSAGFPLKQAESRVRPAGGIAPGVKRSSAGPSATDDGLPGSVIDARYRSDRDDAESPIQLQGIVVAETGAAMPGGTDADPSWSSSADHASPPAGLPGDDGFHNRPPGPWQGDLDRLIARAERELAAMPAGTDPVSRSEYRRRQVHLRLLYLIAHHPEQALTVIPSLDPADQEFWQQMVWAITNSLDADQSLTMRERSAQAIPPVNSALRRLREQADLTIRNAAFCEEISYFGNYKRFPKEEFVPGQPVLLYAEIENFRSDPSPSGEYRTLMRSLIEIVGAGEQIRWKKSFAATEDLCRNPRRDYFHNYQFTIPERLPLGPHTLKLTIVDELSGKQATAAIKFMVK